MKPMMWGNTNIKTQGSRWMVRGVTLCLWLLVLINGGCFEGETGPTYYGRVIPPSRQEFRWSDGGLPRVFDPALAAAPPDTDATRALFEGLTDYDPQQLTPIAGVALRWESSADKRRWTFYLRRDARWSNGDPVTATDFVRSWRRALRLGELAPHAKLLANIVGAAGETPPEIKTEQASPPQTPAVTANTERTQMPETEARRSAAPLFGAVALSEHTLQVDLQRPDANFPALAAHPAFRPVHESQASADMAAKATEGQPPSNDGHGLVTNGAFRLLALADSGVVLERTNNYWNASAVALERVRFVPARDAEGALAAYRAGDIDAVSNANIEPLALKLLASYKDFRRATFGALTYYDFNRARPPFDDLRVRQAFSLAVDRDRLSDDTLQGASEPAEKFLPEAASATTVGDEPSVPSSRSRSAQATRTTNHPRPSPPDEPDTSPEPPPLNFDPERARSLLAGAGYPDGVGFPRVRLLVNRNDQHRAVAQAVAGMWRNTLGVETEIVVLNWDDYEVAINAGVYDVARRSLVMQTTNEASNLLAMFAPFEVVGAEASNRISDSAGVAMPTPDATSESAVSSAIKGAVQNMPESGVSTAVVGPMIPILTERQAIAELPAIPLYFASSSVLVKPYVTGFDTNLLDAPLLQRVRLDTAWKPASADAGTHY